MFVNVAGIFSEVKFFEEVVDVCGVCAFVLYALNFDNIYMYRICKRLGPVRVRRSKYPLLLLMVFQSRLTE